LAFRNDRIMRLVAPVAISVATMLAAASAVNLILFLQPGPRVGDIIAFDAARDVSVESGTRLLVHRPGHFGCVLDLDTVRRGGGSMVLEKRLPGESRSFHLHWAGARTSPDQSDCGTNADLVVDHRDMDILALAAGGYGVGPKWSPTNPTGLSF